MYLKLAWRNIWRNRRRTIITVSSILFAVVCALFIESLERGAHNLMINNMTSFHTGHIQIQDYRYEDEPSLDNAFLYDKELLKEIEQSSGFINFTVPRIEAFMLAAGDELARGAMVLGIDHDAEQKLNSLEERLTEGRFFEDGDGSVVLGSGLAGRLNLSVGDTLALIGQGRFGMTASGLFEVSGLVNHPVRDMNNQLVYISLSDAQWLLSADGYITNLLISPQRLRDTDELAMQLKAGISDNELRVLTWPEMLPDLIEALEFDALQTRFMMGILYVVIGFGIFGTILTMTLERMREFGILLSVGMQRLKLAAVVFLETFMISILGIAAGSGLGYFILLYFYFNPIEIGNDMGEIFEEFGFEPIIPVAIEADIFAWQGFVIFMMSMLICLYPVFKIIRLKILDAARR
jgi:putative ABC transport system permease protein